MSGTLDFHYLYALHFLLSVGTLGLLNFKLNIIAPEDQRHKGLMNL
jgi:hypothetical protein